MSSAVCASRPKPAKIEGFNNLEKINELHTHSTKTKAKHAFYEFLGQVTELFVIKN